LICIYANHKYMTYRGAVRRSQRYDVDDKDVSGSRDCFLPPTVITLVTYCIYTPQNIVRALDDRSTRSRTLPGGLRRGCDCPTQGRCSNKRHFARSFHALASSAASSSFGLRCGWAGRVAHRGSPRGQAAEGASCWVCIAGLDAHGELLRIRHRRGGGPRRLKPG
jgi:hypothetical protein